MDSDGTGCASQDAVDSQAKAELKLLVGLGNPGEEYASTRHNAGFMAVDALLKKADSWSKTEWQPELGELVQASFGGKSVLILKPLAFMNSSGIVVRETVGHFAISPGEMLVVCDDLDIDLGRIRVRTRGSNGGHRGLGSIADNLGTADFPRLRIGIGRPRLQETGIVDFVLGTWASDETTDVVQILEQAACMAINAIAGGVESMSWKLVKTSSDIVNAKVQGESN